jgi:rubrerythrin
MRKLSRLFKKHWWYFILLLSGSIFVYFNRYIILQEKLNKFSAMTLIFLVWLILLLIPLFSEIEIVGVKFKRELEKTKDELSREIKDVRLDIINYKLANNNNNTLNFGSDFLPNIEKLKEMQKVINNSTLRKEPTEEEKVDDIKKYKYSIKFELPEENIFLFKVRTYLEQNLVDICSKFGFERIQNIREMIRFLNQKELINGSMADLLTEIIKISSRGIHGEILSKEYIAFIQNTLPQVEQIFQSINNRIEYFVCPKCKYSGFTQNTSQCPKCGFNTDEY